MSSTMWTNSMRVNGYTLIRARLVMEMVAWAAVAGCCAGVAIGYELARNALVPTAALAHARSALDADMRAACSNWFTDKRTAALPEGRVVVCKAPKFLSNPAHQ